MSEEAQSDIQKYGYNPEDMPDCFLPDNFEEVFQRIGIHGTRLRFNKKGKPLPSHHVEGGVTEEEYIQLAVSVMTAPDAIVSFNQRGGVTRIFGSEIDGQNWILVIPENIDGGKQDPTMFPIKKTIKAYFEHRMETKWQEEPKVLYDSGINLEVPSEVIEARRAAETQKLNVTPPTNSAKQINEIRASQPVNPESASAVQPVVATDVNNQRQSASVAHQNSSERVLSTDPQTSVTADPKVNSTRLDAVSSGGTTSPTTSATNNLNSTREPLSQESNAEHIDDSDASTKLDAASAPLDGEVTEADLQSSAHIDTSVDHSSAVASSQPVAEPVTTHDVETASVDTADINSVEGTTESLSSSELTSEETGYVSDATFDSSEAGSIEAVEMDTPSTDELSAVGEDSLAAGDQSGAVDVSPAEQVEPVGDAVGVDGVSDLETAAPSAEEDDSPSALDVVAYEAVESGEISLDGVPSEDDVGAEDVASEEDNGELDPDFLSSDESSVADQAVATESVDGTQGALSDAEMDDGDDVGVESEAGADGELGAESDASDVPSSDLSLESSEESVEVDDGSLDVDEQATVEDVAALEDAASIEDEGDVDLDTALSVEPAMEDQSGAVDSEDDELDFVSEAEAAELEESLSDSHAALDDATDLQGEFLAADDTDVYDVDESPLAVTDAPADEDVLSDGTADAGDELEFTSETEIAELEESLSDSHAALDDDFISEDEHADMAVQDSPSAFDDTTDLQDDVLSPDDTSSVDDDFLSMDDLAVDEEDLSDSTVDAGDELGVDEPADVSLDAGSDGFDIDADSDADADATDIDADDDDDVSESGGFSL